MTSIIGRIEVGMSYAVLANGWNIDCILSGYRGIDYRAITNNPNPSGEDPCWPGTYFNTSILPEDVIFFKTNRGLPNPHGSTLNGNEIVHLQNVPSHGLSPAAHAYQFPK